MKSMTFKIIEHESSEYQNALYLREDILRKPLGLFLTSEERERDKEHVHIVGFVEDAVCATAVLVPEGDRLKMRQVAVKEGFRGKGFASAMLKFCEEYALGKGFNEIYCHARETAIPFYLKNHYLIEGEPFIETTIPHVKMRKVIRRK
jgi:ribosomal protein S18 acetylase RimI-like enzyme